MMHDAMQTQERKADHIRINLEQDVSAKGITPGFERYQFVHCALPELNWDDIDTSTEFLGHALRAPVVITSMTGGVARAREINQRLAMAAQALGCAMSVGSQRAAIEDATLERFYAVRDVAPDTFIIANLGAVQLNYGYGVDECRRAVDMVSANALALHLNPLQEALQSEGNVNFKGVLGKIEVVCASLGVPVIVKEVGWGISGEVARLLAEVGVAAIDVGGAGGTSWSEVERHRAPSALRQRISATFAGWGIATVDSLCLTRIATPDLPLIGSGGVRSGLDVAKALALGADVAGIASPLLRAAAESEAAVRELLAALIEELRLSMFCSGAETIAQLKQIQLMRSGGLDSPRSP